MSMATINSEVLCIRRRVYETCHKVKTLTKVRQISGGVEEVLGRACERQTSISVHSRRCDVRLQWERFHNVKYC